MKYAASFSRILLCCALAFSLPVFAEDAIDPAGHWDVAVNMGGTPMDATLDIVQNDDASYSGTLNSPMGALTLENVEFTAGESISFAETIGEGDTAIAFNFEGRFSGPNKFEGELESEALGVMSVVGTRGGTEVPIAGIWDIVSDSQLGKLERKLFIYGSGSGRYVGEETAYISDLAVDGNNVSFNVTVDAQGQELPLTFKGAYKGDTLTGAFLMDGQSVAEVTGTLAGKGGPDQLVGTWAMDADTQLGPFQATIEFPSDGDAQLVTEGDTIPLENFGVDVDMVTFDVGVPFEGEVYDVTFEGYLHDDTVEGDFLMGGASVATVEMTRK